ncbi:MAG: nucleotidyltransferase family protein [Clostridia bacterium]|nr:nucleotidyltransferase family protein [Clostridia bacterium]
MTENSQKKIIALVKSALSGERAELAENVDVEKLYKFASRQNIVSLIYSGLVNCGFDGQSAESEQFFISTCQYVVTAGQQDDYIGEIFREFDANKIDYLPLKGTLLRELYPRPEMRAMGDADILIKVEQYDVIKPIMLRLGFTEDVESDHELVWYKDSVMIELHKRLIPSYNKDYYKYFGDGWNKAERCADSTRYQMTKEDNLIYLLTHFAKHYRDAGIGIKHLVDIKLYLEKVPDIDFRYLKKQLEKLNLWEFFNNLQKTIAVWFDGGVEDEATRLITKTIMSGGAFGTAKASNVSAALKDKKQGQTKNRFERFLIMVFPSYDRMSEKFPVLKKCPVLLPFLWVWRLFGVLFKKEKRDSVPKFYDSVAVLNAENINTYERELNAVGLDYRFEEDD